jgi:FMN phosphatase YigB (HAD superfamily)
MIKLKNILNEEETKKLRIFDFDDTLVKSNSRVKVTDKNGNERWLSAGEYAIYTQKPGDKMDYSEFKKVIDPKEIKAVTKILRNFYKANGNRTITILTARGIVQPIQDFMRDIGIERINIVAVDSSDPKKKSDWIEGKIKLGYNDIFFIDDSPKNVAAVKELQKKYPHLKWQIKLARYS